MSKCIKAFFSFMPKHKLDIFINPIPLKEWQSFQGSIDFCFFKLQPSFVSWKRIFWNKIKKEFWVSRAIYNILVKRHKSKCRELPPKYAVLNQSHKVNSLEIKHNNLPLTLWFYFSISTMWYPIAVGVIFLSWHPIN